MTADVGRADVARVHGTIGAYVRRTPVFRANGRDVGLPPFPLTLKLEFMQHGGSFKARGAFTNLLSRPIPPSGVVAASGGNHGVAVAYAANRLGIPAKIFVPTVASPAKVARIRSYDADVVITGDRYADALDASERYVAESDAMPIHAYDQLETLLGQGTLGRELADQVPDAATLLLAVGGGGLLGGVAAWYADQPVRVIGVEPVGAPTLTEALKAGKPVDAPAGSIAADSLAPRQVGHLMFPIAQKHVDRVLLVDDDEIVRAQAALWDVFRLLVEPGGAAAFAAILSGRYTPANDEHVVVVLCGANTDR
ncbi:MAG TPA: threonine/serine dehydratase [Vicinamibacterales bacterium]